MKYFFSTLIACFILMQVAGQVDRKISGWIQGQVSHTLYDQTRGNNPWGLGLGFQAFWPEGSKWRLTMDFTGDLYPGGDKVLRLNPDDSPREDIGAVANLFGGVSFHPNDRIFLSLVAGESMIRNQLYFGIKPSLSYFFSDNQNWFGKLSFTNIFDRGSNRRDDFGSLSISVSVRLF
jgi:hypothetical protein